MMWSRQDTGSTFVKSLRLCGKMWGGEGGEGGRVGGAQKEKEQGPYHYYMGTL